MGLPRGGVWEVDLSLEHQLKVSVVWLRSGLAQLYGEGPWAVNKMI